MNRYLITGFSGFVGSHFVEHLASTGEECQVMGLDVRTPDFACDRRGKVEVGFEKIDLLARDHLEERIREFRPDYILHLASFSSVAYSWEEPVTSFQNNTNIFLNLVDAVRRANMATRILSIGSSEEYGNVKNEDLPLTEERALQPVSPYAVARLSQEYLSRIYADGYGMDIVLTRSFNHIGPMQRSAFFISSLAKQLVELKRSGKERGTVVTGDVSIVRDFTDVRDVVRAYDLLLKRGRKGHVYNVCSGTGLSLKDLIDMMARQLKLKVDIRVDERLIRPADNKKIVGSNKKIRRELGWAAAIPLEQSLRDTLQYWESN